MDEYISLQSVLDIASQYCPDDDGSCSKADVDLREMLDEIEALPTADVQPVKRGKWICTNDYETLAYDTLYYNRCSACGEESLETGDFCPNCGARMIKDGDVE